MKIRQTLILIAYCILIFFFALSGISRLMNKGNTDMTTELSKPTFPILTFNYDGQMINPVYGYSGRMDEAYIHSNITPLMEGRKIAFAIDTYGTKIENIGIELRSVDGSRLIEDSKVYNYVTNKDVVTGEIQLKDLIYENTEYSLCVKIDIGRDEPVRYYTRVIMAPDYGTEEKLKYVYNFSETTFDKEKASEELSTYVESDASGDNTTLAVVDIHSSLDQITWGSLGVKKVTKPIATIKDIDNSIAVITLDYYVKTIEKRENVYYKVTENYRIRLGDERMYLLNYKRCMNQVFEPSKNTIANNKIILGILEEDSQLVEDETGYVFAFVNRGRLFSYNIKDNKLVEIFGFYDTPEDKRYLHMDAGIKICNIEDNGNITFAVYGYMPRGIHEGQAGTSVYVYDYSRNSVEEKTFIPSDKSFDVIARNVKKLMYVSDDSKAYVYDNETIYEIDLKTNKATEVITGLRYESLIVSSDNTMAAWADGDNDNDAVSLTWINMTTGEQHELKVDNSERIKPIAFLENDLIYGVANNKDIYKTFAGITVYPMYKLNIVNEYGEVIKSYEEPGYYIVDSSSDDTIIALERMRRGEDGLVSVSAPGDQILNNKGTTNSKNVIELVATDVKEKIAEITVRKEIKESKLQKLNPKLVLFEGSREATLEEGIRREEYFVYAKGELVNIFSNESDAVTVAYDNGGLVIDNSGHVIYKKTTRSKKNQIMAITGSRIKEEEDKSASVPVCLDTILSYEGYTKATRGLVRTKSSEEILRDNLKEAEVLNLTGCPLDAVLNYVEKDIPVLALLNDGTAVLVIGYNEFNTVIMDPQTGAVYKKGMQDSQKWFEESGNCFITYVKYEE